MKTHTPPPFRSGASAKISAFVIGCFAALFLSSLSAQNTFTIGFDTDGNIEGFVGYNGRTANAITLTTASGLISGTAIGGDPRLVKATATISSTPIFSKPSDETWSTVVFRCRETDDPTSTYLTEFNASGLVVVLNSSNAAGGATIISSTQLSAVVSGTASFSPPRTYPPSSRTTSGISGLIRSGALMPPATHSKSITSNSTPPPKHHHSFLDPSACWS